MISKTVIILILLIICRLNLLSGFLINLMLILLLINYIQSYIKQLIILFQQNIYSKALSLLGILITLNC